MVSLAAGLFFIARQPKPISDRLRRAESRFSSREFVVIVAVVLILGGLTAGTTSMSSRPISLLRCTAMTRWSGRAGYRQLKKMLATSSRTMTVRGIKTARRAGRTEAAAFWGAASGWAWRTPEAEIRLIRKPAGSVTSKLWSYRLTLASRLRPGILPQVINRVPAQDRTDTKAKRSYCLPP